MAQPKDLSITDLSGGVNNFDPPTSLTNSQCTVAENIDFFNAPCGGRRKGCVLVDSPYTGTVNHVPFLYRHLVTSDESEAQLWALGYITDTSLQLLYKEEAWHDIPIVGTPAFTGVYPYQWTAASFHNKMFLAYKSAEDRLHVYDGVSTRPTGLLQPTSAPTGANTGIGLFAGTRYYRFREVLITADGIQLRSEPSDVLTFAPSGTGSGVIVTRPAILNNQTTHWELEASLNDADYYVIDTIDGATADSTDTTDLGVGYSDFDLSEEEGDYEVIPSGRFLLVDEDRLMIGGSFEDDAACSIVRWTPVSNDPGVGNNERIPVATDNLLNLDGIEGGRLTGMAGPIYGSIYAFKSSHIYRLKRTGQRERAYDVFTLSKARGAIEGSIVEAVDETGNPALYFLDPRIGPARLGNGGILSAGSDILGTWDTINLDAEFVVARVQFYPKKNQIHWWIATDIGDTPNFRIVLQIDATAATSTGEVRLGWTTHTGFSSNAIASCLSSTNINDNTFRSLDLKPFFSVNDSIYMLDVGNDDAGTPYTSTIVSHPYLLSGTMNSSFGIRRASIIADEDGGAEVYLSLIRDFGLEESAPADLYLGGVGSEDPVIRDADDLHMSEGKVIQVKITDFPTNSSQWAIQRIDLIPRGEQTG